MNGLEHAKEGLERQLSRVVPLHQVDLRNAYRFARADMPGDDVQREIVPRRRAAGGHDAPRRVREAEIRLVGTGSLRNRVKPPHPLYDFRVAEALPTCLVGQRR